MAVQHTTKTVHTRIFQTAVDLNSALTDVATWAGLPAKYRVVSLRAYDASTSLTLATVGLYTAAAGGGTELVAAFALAALTGAAKTVGLTLAAAAGDYLTSSTLVLRNITAQGGAATASFVLEIEELY